ncbi:MAG: hypothetical protein H6732_02625 [Alphaproteobacteria bacterium]|nr:hypothetical protein [Alphaproteobacteria bacterium]
MSTPPPRAARADRGALLIGLLASAGLVVHARGFLPFFADDALISLRYARHLAEGRGLVWNEGEWVEGYSNLLWVLLVAGGTWLGGDPVRVARSLGVGCAALTGLVLAWTVARGARPRAAATVAAGVWAVSGAAAAWAVGGLEQPLVALLVACAAAALWPTGPSRPALAGLALAALCLTRPDGPVWVGGFTLGHLLVRRGEREVWRDLALVVGLPLGAVAGQLAWRLWVHGELLPNTARVKLAWHGTRRQQGVGFLAAASDAHAVLVAAGALVVGAASRWPAPRAAVALLVPPMAAWSVYVALMGGDGVTFPAWRHVVPLLPLGALLASRVVVLPVLPAWAAAGGVVVLVGGHLAVQRMDPHDALRSARYTRTVEFARQASAVLVAAFDAAGPRLAVTAAGGVPYYTDWPAIDMLGLTDAEVARRRPANLGAGWMGHELHDADAVLARRPDLVMLGMPPGRELPAHPADHALFAHPDWRHYQPVWLEGPGAAWGPPVLVWVREDGRVGVQRVDGEVVVPAVLLGSSATRPARVAGPGAVVLRLDVDAPGQAVVEDLAAGTWLVTVEGDAPVQVEVTSGGSGAGVAPCAVEVSGEGPLVVGLRPVAGVAAVSAVRFTAP